MTTDSAAENGVRSGRHGSKPDIVIHTAEGAIVGEVKSVKGRRAAEDVIAQLLKGGPLAGGATRRRSFRAKPAGH